MEMNDYRKCMSTNMIKPEFKDLSKTERKIYFSVSAKLCSGKAENEKDACEIVKTDHPEWFKEDVKICEIMTKNI